MGTRSFADVPPTAATIALNAYIFGYGGHSLVTPHAALKQLWWTDARIEAKVTRPFVVSKLRGEERQFLDRPLAFGEGLTDDTYMEWILERAKRLFLILTEIGVPEQIFGCIDDSFDDDDLPVTRENVKGLELAYENDEVLNRKFYNTQFVYLLRELKAGAHIDYGPKEHIPMEYVNTLPPAVSLQSWDRVHFPGRPDEIYMRRKYALTDKDTGQMYREPFMKDVKMAQSLQHEHIASLWASYTSEDAGYVLSDFVAEHTLATFIDHRTPMQFLRVPASERRTLLCEWMHCLADALSFLHARGLAHSGLRPSNILIDHTNHIAFADVGSLRTFQRGKKPHKSEAYDYAAPESEICRVQAAIASSPPISSMSAFSKLRKLSSSSSSGSSSTGSSTRSNSMCNTSGSPVTPPSCTGRRNSLTNIKFSFSPTLHPRSSSSSFRNFSRHLYHDPCPSPSIPTSPTTICTPVTILPRPSFVDPAPLLPEVVPETSDIFSLGCVFLDILTFAIRGKLNDFVKFRSTRTFSAGNNNKTRMDTSFHCDPDKIDEWMNMLREDCEKHNEQVFRGLPEILILIRRMMSHNILLRPTAKHVRDRLQEILVDQCGVETLCCAGREWNAPYAPDPVSPSMWDSFSIATGTIGSPPRKGSESLRNGSACGDHMSVISRAETNASRRTARRRSSASVAGAKVSSTWRRAFSRAG